MQLPVAGIVATGRILTALVGRRDASLDSGGGDDENGDKDLSDESDTDISDYDSEADEPLDSNVVPEINKTSV